MMKWKCATTKYVSVVAWSNGIAANMIPERPPITNSAMNPPMKSSGARNSGRPRFTVKSHAKIWIEEGMTTIIEAAAKKTSVVVAGPVANMWCAHTTKPMNAGGSVVSVTKGDGDSVRFAKVRMIDVEMLVAGWLTRQISGGPQDQTQFGPSPINTLV